MQTYQVVLNQVNNSISIDEDSVVDLLLQFGIEFENISFLKKKGINALIIQTQALESAQELKRFCQDKFSNYQIKIEELTTKDWQDKWKEDFEPFFITPDLQVVPVWLADQFPNKDESIYIDTTVAFGTGLHETTKFMAEFLAEQQGKYHSLFDIGTGTGILAMIASRYGATFIDACDLQPESKMVAEDNFKLNNVKIDHFYSKSITDVALTIKYDYVAANLITDVLIDYQKIIKDFVKPKGFLALSGIALHSLQRFKQEFELGPFQLIDQKQGEAWCALLLQRQ